jgi:hypothetical protein
MRQGSFGGGALEPADPVERFGQGLGDVGFVDDDPGVETAEGGVDGRHRRRVTP